MIRKEIKERVNNIRWMENCGEKVNIRIGVKYKTVLSMEVALDNISTAKWENTTLEARNNITSFLYNNDSENYSKWNDFADETRIFIKSFVLPKLEKKQKELGFEDIVLSTIRWDIQTLIMEDIYRGLCGHDLTFFSDLLSVYEAGHLPCGWVGKYPKGTLLIY